MKTVYQILLTNEKTGLYIILGTYNTFEVADRKLEWYIAHNSFFNGEFSIRKS